MVKICLWKKWLINTVLKILKCRPEKLNIFSYTNLTPNYFEYVGFNNDAARISFNKIIPKANKIRGCRINIF